MFHVGQHGCNHPTGVRLLTVKDSTAGPFFFVAEPVYHKTVKRPPESCQILLTWGLCINETLLALPAVE